MKGMYKYQIGLAILGVFTVALVLLVVAQAGSRQADLKTQKQAAQLSDDLEEYLDKNKQIPDSLADAGITRATSNVKYKKISDKEFEICLKYKTNGGGNELSSVVFEEIRYQVDPNYYYDSDYRYNAYYLSLDDTYRKGWDCQTTEPYFENNP